MAMVTEGQHFISGSARFKLLILGATLSMSSIFQMGYSTTYVNTGIVPFRDFLNVSISSRGGELDARTYVWLWSIVVNAWLPSFAVGTWLAMPITDRCGRRNGLLAGNTATLFAIILMTAGIMFESVVLLMLGRVLSAVGAGIAMSALVLFLQEISPAEIRGTMSFYAEMAFVTTNAVGAVLGINQLLGSRLPFLVGFALIPASIAVIAPVALPETPKYLLVKKKNREQAIISARFYLAVKDGEVLTAFIDSIAEDDGNVANGEGQWEHTSVLKACFLVPHVRMGLLLGILTLQITTSIWPVCYFLTEFLRRVNLEYSFAEYAVSGILILSVFATSAGLLLVERFSRRNLFLVASSINLASLFLFVVFSRFQKVLDAAKYGCVLAMLSHGLSYSFATGPIAWFITAELVDTRYRSTCQALALSFNQLIAFLLTLITLPLYELIDSYTILVLFVVPSSLCLSVLFWLLPETRGRTTQEIVRDLGKHMAKNNC